MSRDSFNFLSYSLSLLCLDLQAGSVDVAQNAQREPARQLAQGHHCSLAPRGQVLEARLARKLLRVIIVQRRGVDPVCDHVVHARRIRRVVEGKLIRGEGAAHNGRGSVGRVGCLVPAARVRNKELADVGGARFSVPRVAVAHLHIGGRQARSIVRVINAHEHLVWVEAALWIHGSLAETPRVSEQHRLPLLGRRIRHALGAPPRVERPRGRAPPERVDTLSGRVAWHGRQYKGLPKLVDSRVGRGGDALAGKDSLVPRGLVGRRARARDLVRVPNSQERRAARRLGAQLRGARELAERKRPARRDGCFGGVLDERSTICRGKLGVVRART